MRVRPSSIYKNLLLVFGSLFVFYSVYCIIGYDDGSHVKFSKRQRHLFLTVSGDRIGHRFGTLSPKRILYWTTIFGESASTQMLSDCPGLTDRCVIDTNRQQINAADAVVFHAADIHRHELPNSSKRRPDQLYVFQSMETPDNSHRTPLPDNFFNMTMTFANASNAIDKYGSFFIPMALAEQRGFKVQSYYVQPKRLRKTKSGIFGLISNCDTPSKRELALDALSQFMNVTIGGKCAKKLELKTICSSENLCLDLFEQYPFYVALENTVCNDYISEKFWNRISVPSIPIVMRRKIYETTFPPKSFIAMDDYRNAKEMAQHLRQLETNETAYAEYFEWRQRGTWTTAPWNAPGYRNGICRLCEVLWQRNQTEIEYESIPNVWTWFDAETKCEKDEFVQKWLSS